MTRLKDILYPLLEVEDEEDYSIVDILKRFAGKEDDNESE
jgi:hypothetical protein